MKIIKNANKTLQDFFDQYNRKQETYESKVSSRLATLLMESQNISEKSFTKVDECIEKVKVIVALNEKLVNECKNNKRPELCAELILDSILHELPLD